MGQLGWQKTRKTMDQEKMIMNEVKSAYVEEEVDVQTSPQINGLKQMLITLKVMLQSQTRNLLGKNTVIEKKKLLKKFWRQKKL